jgi:hypothetical protein
MFITSGDGDGGCNDDVDIAECRSRKHSTDHTIHNDRVGVERKMWPVLFPCSEGEDEDRRSLREF